MKQYQDLIRRVMLPENLLPNRTGVDAYESTGEAMWFDLTKGFPATTTKRLAFKSVIGEGIGFLNAYTNAADFRAVGCNVWDANANGEGQPGSPNKWLTNPFREGTDDLGPIYGKPWREWDGYKIIPHIAVTSDPQQEAIEEARRVAIIDKIQKEGWVFIGYADMGPENSPKGAIFHKPIDQLGDCVRTIFNDPGSRRILFHGWNPAILDEVALPACHLLYQFLPNAITRELNMILYIR